MNFSGILQDLKEGSTQFIKNRLDEKKSIKIPAGYYFDSVIGETMEVIKLYKKKEGYFIVAKTYFYIETVFYDIERDMSLGNIELICNLADEINKQIKTKENV